NKLSQHNKERIFYNHSDFRYILSYIQKVKKFHSSTNKTSLFLVFILTAGTRTTFFPSSSISKNDVSAIPDWEKEKTNCNNINLVLNGLNVTAIPYTLRNVLQAQAETEGAESGTSNFNGKDFSFICLNNNDNEFIIPQAPQAPQSPPTEPPTSCEVTVSNIAGIINPSALDYDPVKERMYVSNGGDFGAQGNVSVFDTDTNTLIDTDGENTNGITPITIGGSPSGISYDPVNKRMYVTNDRDTNVSVIDTTTNTVIATIPIGFSTSGIAYDSFNERMYVTVPNINCGVFVIDTDTNTLIDTDGDDTNGMTPILIGRAPIDIAYDSFNKRMYVVTFRSLDVSVIDTTTNTVTTTIQVGLDPFGIEYDSVNERMYVAKSAFPDGNSTVSVIDTGNNTEIDTDGNATNGITRIIVGQDATFLAYDPINKHMYGTNFVADSVSVIYTTTNTVIDTIPVGGTPVGITYDPVNHRMYVGNNNLFSTDNDSVSVINLCPRPEL
ncbi:MAG TPA: YncE family protein, partial [Nitrososphaeraceae archaeon]|nr:YncE family protein [Nitrososphaeraceae archaeon]